MTGFRAVLAASLFVLAACEPPQPTTEALAAQIVAASPEQRAPLLASAIAQRQQSRIGSLLSDVVAVSDIRAEGAAVVYEFIIAADVSVLSPAQLTEVKSILRPAFLSSLCDGSQGRPTPFDYGVVVRTIIKDIGGRVVDAFDVTQC